MSVFTPLSVADCKALLQNYTIGEYRHHEGLPGGVENSNFVLLTTQGRFVITLFERQPVHDARYTLSFMQRCRARGIYVPTVIITTGGLFLVEMHDKPAAICTQLEGGHIDVPGKHHCHAVGRTLALLHRVGTGQLGERPNPFGDEWRNRLVTQVHKYLDKHQREILQEALQVVWPSRHPDLPVGTIHADVFRDNVLFEGNRLTGIVDFECACQERYMLDLATSINDWCNTATGRVSRKLQQAMLQGYASVRIPGEQEYDAIPVLLVESALRFWLSRLYDQFFERAGIDVEVKSPGEFEQRLRHRLKALNK